MYIGCAPKNAGPADTGLTGCEVLEARREDLAASTPVIVMSASRNIDEDAVRAHAVLGKPFAIR